MTFMMNRIVDLATLIEKSLLASKITIPGIEGDDLISEMFHLY